MADDTGLLDFNHIDTGSNHDDDDSDTFECASTPAVTQSERRREKKAIFDSWLETDAGQEALKPRTKDGTKLDEAQEVQSITALMSKQEGRKIIQSPRDYQVELFERAKKENTIAVLGTGTGKTLIAGLLLQWTIDQELEDRSAGKPPRISFFLVDSVALAIQQSEVLRSNLDHKVFKVVGDDGADTWPKQRWLGIFNDNKIIVCTAAILHTCLSRNYYSMRQINLIIFDEAHHAHGKHFYARIIQDFYLDEDLSTRPKIFGMTASPIDAKGDAKCAGSELEALLHSKIATTMAKSISGEIYVKPVEQDLVYSALPEPFETQLLRDFKTQFGHITLFEHIFARAPRIARELGVWCADRYLCDSLTEKKLPAYEAKLSRKSSRRSVDDTHALDQQLSELQSAAKFVREAIDEQSRIGSANVFSSKVQRLIDYLSPEFETPTARRCIVFVEQRSTAMLLAAVFLRLQLLPHLHCAYLIGAGQGVNEDNMSLREQVLTLKRFRDGDINCLFATSVAEEGLDVQDCNLVVRFDKCKTMIQYVQSRGRARQKNSKFIHMLESGNSIERGLVQDMRRDEMTMLQFCQTLPADRKLFEEEDVQEMLKITEESKLKCTEDSTGARLDLGNALVILANFVSTLNTQSNELLHPTYVVSAKGSKFQAEVILPSSAPLRFAVGGIYSKKTLAKRSAAFKMCKTLRDKGFLNEYFMPTFRKKIPVLAQAHLAFGMHKKAFYAMRQKPSVWEQTSGVLPTELWLTILDFPDGLVKKHQPLILLTRTPLPSFPTFSLILGDCRQTRVCSQRLEQSLQVDEGMLTRLTTFTLRVYRDIFLKLYEHQPHKLSYWLAPAVSTTFLWHARAKPDTAIDWQLLERIYENAKYPWTENMPPEFLAGKYVFDELGGGRTYFTIAVEPSLTPFDPIPEHAAKAKGANRSNSILDYSDSFWKRTRNIDRWKRNQPVVRAELLPMRRDMLSPPDPAQEANRTLAFICPEPLAISALPIELVEACLVFPSIIHRFESYMIAQETCELVGVDCSLELALEAITKDSDNSGEHEDEERINFQHGMGPNYERLEFIGDTFLKTATTISTYVHNPTDTEYEFHCTRMGMLCNKNLFRVAKELELYEFIRSKSMTRHVWQQEGLTLLGGKVSKDKSDHNLGQKTIADVCEALIGAAFVAHDRRDEEWQESHWENAVHAVTKLVGHTSHQMETWSDYRKAYTKQKYQLSHVTASQRDMAAKVELEHRYRFKYPPLLRSAFTHPSQLQTAEPDIPDYQQLEFLGDALLDMASITHLFYRHPDKDPQWLTEHKMAMVSNKFLGAVCVTIGFHKHLRFGHNLGQQIFAYATELEAARDTPGAGRDYWTSVCDPPKCLPDIVESYIGAMFIDSDFDYNVVRDFFNTHIAWFFEDMSIYDTFANHHPCTHLHNLLQSSFGCRDYALIPKEVLAGGTELSSTDVAIGAIIHNKVIACAKGSKRYAEARAAKEAIEQLEGLAPYEFRSQYGCNCRSEGGVVDGIAARGV